jgi:hypothetical protein
LIVSYLLPSEFPRRIPTAPDIVKTIQEKKKFPYICSMTMKNPMAPTINKATILGFTSTSGLIRTGQGRINFQSIKSILLVSISTVRNPL